ncbi:MAG: hypothetical protein R3B70_26085 [Polyangiaceae bacterium]
MMTEMTSTPLPIWVRLRRGMEPRKVRIAIYSNLESHDRASPRRVLGAFTAALDARLFGGARASEEEVSEVRMPHHGLSAVVWTGTLSRTAPCDLCVVAHMVKASVPAACGLEIVEQHPNERALLVRALGPDPEATLLDVDWAISFDPHGSPGISLRFAEPPARAVVLRFEQLVRAWAEMVSLGAYPLLDGRSSRARFSGTELRREACLFAGFDRIRCGHSAFEALFSALNDLHREAPITRVDVACGAEEGTMRAPGVAA